MDSGTANSTVSIADIVAYVDEAGEKGYLRELDPSRDLGIGLMCALPIPQQHLQYAQGRIRPLFDRFKSAAPPKAKLHITEAFKPGHDSWRVVAEQVRSQLFELLIELNCIVIYVARRCSVVRRSFEATQKLVDAAKSDRRSPIRIIGSNRPPDATIEDDLVTLLGLLLDEFVAAENMNRVDIKFDQIDEPVAKRYAAELEETRNISNSQHPVQGWNTCTKEKVFGSISMKAEADFRLDTQHLGSIDVVGKDDPLIFAVDVVANSLWRHLKTLPPDALLNDGPSVEEWILKDRIWAKNEPKNWDLF